MNDLAVLVDFGSTFTKVVAVDLNRSVFIGRAQSQTTVATDVRLGLQDALLRLAVVCPAAFAGKPRSMEGLLEGAYVRASSSAAGGLRIVVVGNVPGLTVAAANAAALGAGAKVIGAFGFRLQADDMAALRELAPDLVLLTGGADGGDVRTILHNAARLAETALNASVVVAGNSAAAQEAQAILVAGGMRSTIVENVMPWVGMLRPEASQSAIRELFMKRITLAKGLEAIQSYAPVVYPTPMAVFEAVKLVALGVDDLPGRGDLVLVDIGGATTDVYSIGEGRKPSDIPESLAESFAKRTVEGDLGVRWNAATLLERVGEQTFFSLFETMFPNVAIERAALAAYVAEVARDTGRVPSATWQAAADAVLARIAADIAIERHVGRRELYYAPSDAVWLQSGKDMSETPLLLGTGGIFAGNAFADLILEDRPMDAGRKTVLRPRRPVIMLDKHYVLYAIGLLAEDYPRVALELFETSMHVSAAGARPETIAGMGYASLGSSSTCACCGDGEDPFARARRRSGGTFQAS